MLSASHRGERRWLLGVGAAEAAADGTDAVVACVAIGYDEGRGALGGGGLRGAVEWTIDPDGPCVGLPKSWLACCDCNKRKNIDTCGGAYCTHVINQTKLLFGLLLTSKEHIIFTATQLGR